MTLPPKSWSTCSECGSAMPLLLQIYSPREESSFERILFTFGCTFDGCQGFRAFRVCTKWLEEEEEIVEEVAALKNPFMNHLGIAKVDLFGSGNPFATPSSTIPSNSNPFSSNPFAPPSNPFAPPNPIESFEKLAIAEKATAPLVPEGPSHLRWKINPSLAQEAFPSYYLTTSYEPIVSTPKLSKLSQQSSTYLPTETSREGKGAGGRIKKGAVNNKPTIKASSSTGEEGGWGTEGYEVQKVVGVDEVFLRFLERVGREGSQLIR